MPSSLYQNRSRGLYRFVNICDDFANWAVRCSCYGRLNVVCERLHYSVRLIRSRALRNPYFRVANVFHRQSQKDDTQDREQHLIRPDLTKRESR
ncbi:hypothetical protein ABKV19_001095 [Rosa sericea]